MRLTTLKPEKEKIAKGEVSAAHFIPYKCHWNSNTILTYKEELVRVIKIKGFAFETADDIDIDLKKNARNNLLKGMASGNFSLYFHTLRRKEKGFPDGDMPDLFSERVNKEWAQKHSDEKCFINEHYLTLVRGADTSGAAVLEHMAKKLQHRTDKTSWENYMRESFDELDEMTERILNGFGNYGAHLLELNETEDGVVSEVLEFLCRLINCGHTQPITVPLSEISHHLPVSRLYFGNKSIEAHHIGGVKYAGIVSIKEYRPSTHAGVFDGFMQMPFELIISQSFSFINRMVAISSMQLQQRRLVQSEDVAVSQIQEIDQALDSAMSGEFGFGLHHLTVLCIEDTPKSLESALSLAIVELSNSGITGVREKMNLEPAFWAQLPCNAEFMARRSVINTFNIVSFASFHNYPSGKRKKNHWGDAVTVLNTVSGTPYFFSFHVRDVGHTMIIGPTGAGKTVLLNFLCAQAQKFNPRLFFFDKDRGAEIFVRAVRGRYMIPDAAKVSGFNPFQLEDNNENRAFLIEFLKALVLTGEAPLPAHEVERLNEAVNGNYKLPKNHRRLRNIAAFMGLGGPGTLAGRLSMWHSGGSHSKLFDNEDDVIDFTSARTFGIEMASILSDKAAIAPVLLYLFHRIQSSLRGDPTMIVLDEAWALIGNPVFAPKIKDWLKVLRKLNCFVVFATQSVEDAAKSSISDTLVQQTSTQIFLPNLKATTLYREVFMLSEREFNLVKTTDPSTRFFLVKQDNDGVIARIDLGGMDEVIRVLSARADTIILLDKIIDEVGDDPDDWLPVYYEKSGKS
ncbi:MAG: type IV secretion system protein VirB4 [Alphaproteobacteria bacterium RIFCSPLOWO2_01_FULL_40_26]|nr:MAG: type IV secretion system protein VirB4 [Alphaproteobacteria bacterium RIFCSPHIGHO2_02_FULL_40_34]OFW94409.1 MAG: type IV secretion system protein VirB4 [Alphaproteobacteria bacterium RIFCSPLOWO2_01_FULL_40_26]OFX09443.1 MAG: type IV secretion system protein VirB4 [Alphaproteobacteria bacterium RIFCSPLOWO2_02_FULL_40_19]OFX11643.1 MAG: type IV secretion system protein VirB4 [Alphaproteobacteria bacterium RIFCSPLOWO2_12_FULL_40_11]